MIRTAYEVAEGESTAGQHASMDAAPIQCAILWNRPRMVETLLECGADIELRDSDRNTTPVRYAAMYCRADSLRVLIARGAQTGRIADKDTTLLELAKAGAAGEYAEFDDLPRPEEYRAIIDLVSELTA